MLSLDDTIVARATPPAGAARAIIRMSGKGAVDCLRRCFAPSGEWPSNRHPHVVRGELTGEWRLPSDAFLWPSRQSYTREPAVELHLFGSTPLVDIALHTLCSHGARLAQPGEFTLRAFLAGRIDLTQAEAVLGVIDADDRQRLAVALAQLAGGLAGPLTTLRSDLLDLLADLEAGLDFVDEDIEFITLDEVTRRIRAAQAHLQSIRNAMSVRSTPRGVPRVVLVGLPNAGKSSLFNALVGRERAIVSDVAGTTRDFLEATTRFGDLECVLVDTAGRDNQTGAGTVAIAAQQSTAIQAAQADLQLLCIDSAGSPGPEACAWHSRDWPASNADPLVILTKCDAACAVPLHQAAIQTSAVTGHGLDGLRAAIARRLASTSSQAVSTTAERCRDSIERAIDSLARVESLAAADAGHELIAAETRMALDELAKVTGAVYTEDVLDRIFSRFCIGK